MASGWSRAYRTGPMAAHRRAPSAMISPRPMARHRHRCRNAAGRRCREYPSGASSRAEPQAAAASGSARACIPGAKVGPGSVARAPVRRWTGAEHGELGRCAGCAAPPRGGPPRRHPLPATRAASPHVRGPRRGRPRHRVMPRSSSASGASSPPAACPLPLALSLNVRTTCSRREPPLLARVPLLGRVGTACPSDAPARAARGAGSRARIPRSFCISCAGPRSAGRLCGRARAHESPRRRRSR